MTKPSIKFDFHKNPSSSLNSNEGTYHVRINNNRTINLKEISEILERRTTVTNADIAAVLAGIRSILVEELSRGNAINLDDICRLQVQLGTQNGACMGKEHGDQLVLKSIKAQSSKSLVDDVRKNLAPRERCHVSHSIDLSKTDLYKVMDAYFENHAYITRQNLQNHLGITRYKATNLLKHCVEQGLLSQPEGTYGALYYPCEGGFSGVTE